MRTFDRKISVKEMQIQDRNSSEYGISPSTLMECAGYSAMLTILEKYPQLKKSAYITVICGTGNNGGDGFVIARHLLSAEFKVTVLLVGDPDHIGSIEAKQNFCILQSLKLNLKLIIIKDSSFFSSVPKEVQSNLAKSAIIIDCLLGTGIRGNIREPIRSAIEFINKFSQNSTKIVSIDVPSGIDPNTGDKADCWVKADLLITFHRKKLGFDNITVDTIVNAIGIPPEADLFVGQGDLDLAIPKRTEFAHKGEYGKVLIIGGSEQYSGAPALAGMAALQMGVDLVYIFAPNSVADTIRGYSPNLIVRSGSEQNICRKDIGDIQKMIERVDAVVIGPGIGDNYDTTQAFPDILNLVKKHPVVIDANAIKLLQAHKTDLPAYNMIITPHANEFFELTGKKLPDQSQFYERIKFLEKIVKEWGILFLVKGRYDYITNGMDTRINKTGVPEMSVGGTGDILTGILASLLAIKVDPFEAACCAAYINGKLGEFHDSYLKGSIKYRVPMKSSDLLAYIPQVIKQNS